MNDLITTQRKLIAVYAVWFFIHLVFLFLSDKSGAEYFWPLNSESPYWDMGSDKLMHAYDFSEFLVYAVGPAVLILAYLLFTKK